MRRSSVMSIRRSFSTAAAAVVVAAIGIAAAGSWALAQQGAAKADQGWTTYADPRTGFSFSYPSQTFVPHAKDPTEGLAAKTAARSGVTFVSRDGKAWFQVAAYANTERLTLAIYRSRMLTRSYSDARITFERTTPDFVIVSGLRGGTEFYERVVFSCDGRVVNFWMLTYPAAESATYDRIVEEVARTFRPVSGRERCATLTEPLVR